MSTRNQYRTVNGNPWNHAPKKRKGLLPKSSATRGFAAAKTDDLTYNFAGSYLSVNEELRHGLRSIRAKSRQLFMDNDYAKKFGHMCKSNIVGVNGIVLQARAKNNGVLDERDNAAIEAGWKEWCKPKNCTTTGRHSWKDVQNISAISVPRCGEILVQLIDKPSHPFGFVIRLLSADYLDENHNVILPNGNRILMGVEEDRDGLIVAYHLRDQSAALFKTHYPTKNYKRVKADDIVHLFVSDFPDQARGLPWMHTAIRRLNMIGGYEEAELVAARLGASKMGFYTTENGGEVDVDDMTPGVEEGQDSDLVEEVEPGMLQQLNPGEGFVPFDPQHPTSAFSDFMKAVLRGAASGLNVAYNSIANDLENVNFSSIRAGTIEERDHWKQTQGWMIEHLHSRVYERWLSAAIFKQKLRLPLKKIDDKYMDVHWQARGWAWVDPLKDSKAHSEKIAGGRGTRTAVLAEEGRDFNETIETLAYEEMIAKKAGVNINPHQGIMEAPSEQETSQD
ncbi:phage portal protein [uncultured Paraglaciecola sp.]|uniref:phage portal protein n=1 Tax=uncultured Paraglaciecola sp. TaxID=1765024 RepID=UPI0026267071|nr:phage portal protein [uncultured Paraglaciecola sp.]